MKVGDKTPEFQAIDSEGSPFTSEDLLGSVTVLYFYPKDETPGCTKEACDFRDKMADLERRGILVIGVSPDNLASHQNFIENHELNFCLLSDSSLEMCRLFEVLSEKNVHGKKVQGVERTTFIIDDKGIIRWIERPVTVENHITRVLRALDDL